METPNRCSQTEAALQILSLLDQAEEGDSPLSAATALDKAKRFGLGDNIGMLRTNVDTVLKNQAVT